MPDADEPIRTYLDRVLARARLPAEDARAVRSELHDHLRDLIDDHPYLQPSEVYTMLEREFGNPERVGAAIARSKGRLRILLKTRGRRVAVRLAVTLAVLFSVRCAVAEEYYITSASLAPILPQGSRCLVYKLATRYAADDVVVYRSGQNAFVGQVVGIEPTGAVRVRRNTGPELTVPAADLVGKVVLNTR